MAVDIDKVYIVSHTHWDREWYLTYHTFRIELAHVVRGILDALENDDSFRHFVLDGQAVILEDYLEIHPENRDRIAALAKAGALSLGPWYILPDEFLVSAESHVRNLLYGHEVAGRFGPVQKIGYLPDTFGHIAQMPQILSRSGIDSFVYTRGNGDEIADLGNEFLWMAPDGSEVLAIHQRGGYCNAGGLGYQEIWHAHTDRKIDIDRAVDQVRRLLSTMAATSNGPVALLNNGCDHFPPQARLGEIVEALRREFPGKSFIHASFGEYLNAVRNGGFAKKKHCGELIGGRLHHILSGVWSARIYLKQRNEAAQNLLANILEPLASYATFVHHLPYPDGAIDYAWKLLLKNHPHDSICGCSIDPVHEEMLPRFAGVVETGEQLLRGFLKLLTPTFAGEEEADSATVLCVANSLPMRRTEVVERLVVLQPSGIDPDRLGLFDASGKPVPMEVVEKRYVERFWGIDYREELFGDRQEERLDTYIEALPERMSRPDSAKSESDCLLRIRFLAEDLPGVGHRVYFLREVESDSADEGNDGDVRVGATSMENDRILVTVHSDGTFDLLDKTTGQVFKGLNRLEDTEDVGDEYDYAPAIESRTVTSVDVVGSQRIVESSPLCGRIDVAFALELPRAVDPDRQSRSGETIFCPCKVRFTLRAGSPMVEIDLKFENRAMDHRLRARFPTPIETDEIVSDGHFLIQHRPLRPPTGDDWVQPAPGTYPQQDFSLLQDGCVGLCVLNRGLPEIEGERGAHGGRDLFLTLLRSVGWLSRDDFDTRKRSNAGPTIPTPGAQCLGPQRFRYAIAAFAGDYLDADIKGMSQRYRCPVLVVQGVEDQHVPDGGLFEKGSSDTCVTAIKKCPERNSLIIRLYNTASHPSDQDLQFGLKIAEAWRTDLLENRLVKVDANGGNVTLTLGPHEIVTLEFLFA